MSEKRESETKKRIEKTQDDTQTVNICSRRGVDSVFYFDHKMESAFR